MRKLVVLLLALAACNASDFRPASLVYRPRIVGMISHVAADATRAAPLGGEQVELETIVVAPEGEEGTLSTAWLACLAAPTRTGVPSCGGAPLGTSGPPAPGVVQPIVLDLPEVAPSPLGAPSILLTVVSCDGGAVPDLSMLSMGSTTPPSCVGGEPDARAELTLFTMPVALAAATANHHPSIDDETFTIELEGGTAMAWNDAPFPSGNCAALAASPELPRFVATGEEESVILRWTSSGDDRERYSTFLAGTGEPVERREALQVSHYVTAGELPRQFSGIESMEPDTTGGEIAWTTPAPADVPEGGLVVRFFWVERDLRGGFDVAQRALCLVRE